MKAEIPFVDDSDIQHWKSKNDRLMPRLESMLKNGDIRRGNTPYVLARLYRDQAIIDYLNEDLSGFYENLGKVVDVYELLIKEFLAHRESIDEGYFSHAFYAPLVCAALSGDRSRLSSFCEIYSVVLGLYREPFFTDFLSSLYYLCKGDTGKSLSYGLVARSDSVDGCKALTDLLVFIAGQNKNGIDAVWGAALQEYDRYIQSDCQGMPDAALFMDGLALLKLNMMVNGELFQPVRSDPRVPVSLLNHGLS